MIKRRREVPRFMKKFTHVAQWDGFKYYLHVGDLTIMRYHDGSFTYHRKNDIFWDLFENPIEPEELNEFIWKHRSGINRLLSR